MIAKARKAMSACARPAVVHPVAIGRSVAAKPAMWIDDGRPECTIATSCGVGPGRAVHDTPPLDGGPETVPVRPEARVIVQRAQQVEQIEDRRDIDWHVVLAGVAAARCLPVAGDRTACILYAYGTKGRARGSVRFICGQLVAFARRMRAPWGVRPGQVVWPIGDVGRVVGRSCICHGPLVHGCTGIVHESTPVETPDAGAVWRVIARHGVSCQVATPAAMCAIRREDHGAACIGGHDPFAPRSLCLAGKRADRDRVQWVEAAPGLPIIAHRWQTQTARAICSDPTGLGGRMVKTRSPGAAMPDCDGRAPEETGGPVPSAPLGAIAIRPTLPPGAQPTLRQADARVRAADPDRLPRDHTICESGLNDAGGDRFAMARTDDVRNGVGHLLPAGRTQAVPASHPMVAGGVVIGAVIGAADALHARMPVNLTGVHAAAEPVDVAAQCAAPQPARIGPAAAFTSALGVDRLCNARAGTILHAPGAPLVDEVRAALAWLGHAVAGAAATARPGPGRAGTAGCSDG